MRFGEPVYFNLLWLLPALIFFLLWALRKKRALTIEFCSPALAPKFVGEQIHRRQNMKVVFIVLALFFMIVALTQPRWGYEWKDMKQEGVDIIVALDVSKSMLAEDIKPNRLSRAKRKISDLLDMLEGDRVGLVAFAGTAFVQCPLTLDYSAAKLFLDATDTDLLSNQGTALAGAIRKSVAAFRSQDKKSKAIILITDGESHGDDPLEAAKWAAEQGVKIFTIGIGKDTGAPIPDAGGGFKKDAKGEIVLTRLDEPTLQQIALETGGTYVRSVTGDLDLDKIYLENIKPKIDKKELQTQRRKLWTERFQWFVILAIACLLLEFTLRERPYRQTLSK
ncbi:MAG: VWA domain-containing protein [Nitrospinae bacterium]|jgi:Ca-activated chloride channel homolog|nr:VWA domain-containing protein [Nitrospinota bacterium]MDA1108515.1 VWA domain-containing protein [Nitrospinota bacterium]